MALHTAKFLQHDGTWRECLKWGMCIYSPLQCLGITVVRLSCASVHRALPMHVLVHDDFGFLVPITLDQTRASLTGDAR